MTSTAETRFRFGPVLAATVATVLLLLLVWKVAETLLLLFIAVLLSLFLGSVTDFLVERLGMPRGAAFAAAVILTLGAIWGLGALLVPPVVVQTRQLIGVLPDYVRAWQDGVTRMVLRYPALREIVSPQGEIVTAIIAQLQGAVGRIVPTVVNVGHQLINIVSILVMGIYLALHPALYREWLIALFPPVHRDVVRDVLTDMGHTLRSWLVAQLLAMTILATLTAIVGGIALSFFLPIFSLLGGANHP